MKVIYLAGKYRGSCPNEVYENIQHARREAFKLWQENWAVICPHMNTMFMDFKESGEPFISGDLEILKRCDAIFMLSNWKDSEGAKKEFELAQELGLEIFYEPMS